MTLPGETYRPISRDLSLTELQAARLAVLGTVAQLAEESEGPLARRNNTEGELYREVVRLATSPHIWTSDIFRAGKLLVNCFPSEVPHWALKSTDAGVVTPLTTIAAAATYPELSRSLSFYGLERDSQGTEYLCVGMFWHGAPSSAWMKDHYKDTYKIRGGDYRIIVHDTVQPIKDGQPSPDGRKSATVRHPLYDNADGEFRELFHSYCELNLRREQAADSHN